MSDKSFIGWCAALLFAALETHAGSAPAIDIEYFPGKVIGFNQTDMPPNLLDVRSIAAGLNHTVALKSDGTVVAWGGNFSGQATVPVGLKGVKAIAAGGNNTVALKDDGTLTAWGNDDYGQVRKSSNITGVRAIAAGNAHIVALLEDGTVIVRGNNEFVPAGLAGVQAIAAGGSGTLALKSDGTVIGWGLFDSGQSRVPVGLNQIRRIAAGELHALALKNDGSVVAWGDNTDHQTEVPAGLSGVREIAAGTFASLALKLDGTLVGWGQHGFAQGIAAAGLKDVRAIAMGQSHLVVIAGLAAEFGTMPVGSAGTEKQFIVRNSGSADLTITSVVVLGPNASDFQADTSAMSPTLSPLNGPTTFVVRFRPSGPGARTATLRVLSNDVNKSPNFIRLAGTCTPRFAVFNGASTAAPDERVDGIDDADFVSVGVRTFTIKNVSQATMTNLAISKTGDTANEFLVGELGATALEPGATTTFEVTFSARRNLVEHRALLAIVSNNEMEHSFEINLRGIELVFVPGVIPLTQVLTKTNISGDRRLVFNLRLDRAGAFDVTCRLTGNVFSSLVVDGIKVAANWCGKPGGSYTVDHCFFGPPYPCQYPVLLSDVSFPQIQLSAGNHRIEIVGGESDELGRYFPPVVPTLLSFSQVKGTLEFTPIVTGNGSGDGPLSQVEIVHPVHLAADSKNNIYLAEFKTGRIRKITPEGIVSTIYQWGPVAAAAFRNFYADSAGNCYLRATDPAKLYKMHPDGELEVLVMPIVGMSDPPAYAQYINARSLLDVTVMPDGRIYYLLRLDYDLPDTPGSYGSWGVYTAGIKLQASGVGVVEGGYSLMQNVGPGFGRGFFGGYQSFSIFPSTVSPIAEYLGIPPSPDSGYSPTHYGAYESADRTLVGYRVPASKDPVKYLISDGPDYYSLRDRHLYYLSRGYVRSIYNGQLTSIAGFPDGSLIATDGARLLKYVPPPTVVSVRLDPAPGGASYRITVLGNGATSYDIQASADLKQWVSVSTGLPDGGTYTTPKNQVVRFYRARKSGD